jgi:hypothetical protein
MPTQSKTKAAGPFGEPTAVSAKPNRQSESYPFEKGIWCAPPAVKKFIYSISKCISIILFFALKEIPKIPIQK